MKFPGGYQPPVTGRPASTIRTVPCPDRLILELHRDGLVYQPCVPDGETVRCGQAIAEADVPGGRIALPAPAAGRVERADGAAHVGLHVTNPAVAPAGQAFALGRATARELRQALAAGGCWPLLWSSTTAGVPHLDPAVEQPRRIVVTAVSAEPFRARGHAPLPVQFTRFWCVFGASYALSEGLLFVFHSLLHLGPMPAKIAAEAMVGLFNFTLQRQWTFR